MDQRTRAFKGERRNSSFFVTSTSGGLSPNGKYRQEDLIRGTLSTMAFHCPSCGAAIPDGSVDTSQGVACCAHCGTKIPISKPSQAVPNLNADEVRPPKNLRWKERTKGDVIIVKTGESRRKTVVDFVMGCIAVLAFTILLVGMFWPLGSGVRFRADIIFLTVIPTFVLTFWYLVARPFINSSVFRFTGQMFRFSTRPIPPWRQVKVSLDEIVRFVATEQYSLSLIPVEHLRHLRKKPWTVEVLLNNGDSKMLVLYLWKREQAEFVAHRLNAIFFQLRRPGAL